MVFRPVPVSGVQEDIWSGILSHNSPLNVNNSQQSSTSASVPRPKNAHYLVPSRVVSSEQSLMPREMAKEKLSPSISLPSGWTKCISRAIMATDWIRDTQINVPAWQTPGHLAQARRWLYLLLHSLCQIVRIRRGYSTWWEIGHSSDARTNRGDATLLPETGTDTISATSIESILRGQVSGHPVFYESTNYRIWSAKVLIMTINFPEWL